MTACAHCGAPIPEQAEPEQAEPAFCCKGCAGAYGLVQRLGLGRYYTRRSVDRAQRALKPEDDLESFDTSAHVSVDADGISHLSLMVDGIHCAACVWLIESVLARAPDVVQARVNLTSRRLALAWRGPATDADRLLAPVRSLGYRFVPFDARRLDDAEAARDRALLRAMAVAGFAAGNIMLLSVSVWAGQAEGMGPATRGLLHWVSALIALPAVAYAGQPFVRSAFAALRLGRLNMDVPISLGVILATGVSLFETATGGLHAYFDSAVALLFFLLVGRYLDSRARSRARSAARELLALAARAATVVDADGRTRFLPPDQLAPGMTVLVAAGERVAVDGIVREGCSDIDSSLVTGESLPVAAGPGDRVLAGTVNVSAPIKVETTAVGAKTVLAEIGRLMEAAEQGRSRFVGLADHVARLYSPAVHLLAATTLVGGLTIGGLGWHSALLNAIAVLIITCPCALALAVPAVQVVATGRLMRHGLLMKSGSGLERLAAADHVVMDKTGTLTLGRPEIVGAPPAAALAAAAALAGASRHPLARAIRRAAPDIPVVPGVREIAGGGLVIARPDGETRLGSRAFCGIDAPAGGIEADGTAVDGPELWLVRPGHAPVHFRFRDTPRPDARAAVDALRGLGLRVEILSGDRASAVAAIAAQLGIGAWQAGVDPAAKQARLAALAEGGHRVLMVGDGLNDAPALAQAHVSISPASGADISQVAADAVFQGERLMPVVEAVTVARKAEHLIRENLGFALAYNLFTIPLAMLGYVTPLVAAIAMSSSSLIVIGNSLRLGRRRP
ncbi:MAG: heavy metal translocating P-type ATPase metal-binding domain-containing protein [Alphaproteobacteria bacterium]